MKKIITINLESLSNKELGKLFPIQLVPYNSQWPSLFEIEKKKIQMKLGKNLAKRIEHFGSTSIKGMPSKPIIDMLVEIPKNWENKKQIILEKMQQLGYRFIWRTDERIPYMHFIKGYTESGYDGQVFHIHMGDKEHPLWERLAFRDYLIHNKSIANKYITLKKKLATKYTYDREKYTQGKSNFVKEITKQALANIPSNEQSPISVDGDLRSIGNANSITQSIHTQIEFDNLFKGLFSDNRLEVMRTADALEKITINNPRYLFKHKQEVITLLKSANHIELKWHLVLLIGRLPLSKQEFDLTWELLSSFVRNTKESKIVRVNALQTLHDLNQLGSSNSKYSNSFQSICESIRNDKSAALKARLRKLSLNSN